MDKTSKKILKYLKAQNSDFICWFGADLDGMAHAINITSESANAAVVWMVENGYIEYVPNQQGRHVAFTLSHIGRNSGYFARRTFLKYVGDKWIDFFALLISLGALILSLIALLR